MIHPTAIVDKSASIGKNVKIGPFCIVGKDVSIGDNVELKSHVVVDGITTIGEGTVIYPFASIGHAPQDLKYENEPSTVVIGKNNVIREYVTIQPGTKTGRMITSVGDGCLLMVGTHIAHDCKVGNKVIFANNATLAGHVEVGDHVIIGGLAAIQQHVRIGDYAIIGGLSGIIRDLIPFGMAVSPRADLEGLNLVGIKRHGFDTKEALAATKALEMLFEDDGILFKEKISLVADKYNGNSIVMQILDFLKRDTTRSTLKLRK